MTKNTMGTKLPRKLVQKMSIVGEQIELARLRRNLSVAQIAERATCSLLTVSRIEKGAPTDNDMGAGLQNKYAAWKNPGLKLISLFYQAICTILQ